MCSIVCFQQTVELALERLPEVEPLAQHEAVKGMYSWQAVRQRTEAVYFKVWQVFDDSIVFLSSGGHWCCLTLSRLDSPQSRDEDMLGALQRSRQAGPWYGLICCCILALGWLVWKVLDWWDPPSKVPQAPRFPGPTPSDKESD